MERLTIRSKNSDMEFQYAIEHQDRKELESLIEKIPDYPCAECIEAGGCPIREDCPNEGKKKSKSDMIVEQLEILKQKNPFIHGEKDNSLEASVSRQTLDYAIQVITKGGGADEY